MQTSTIAQIQETMAPANCVQIVMHNWIAPRAVYPAWKLCAPKIPGKYRAECTPRGYPGLPDLPVQECQSSQIFKNGRIARGISGFGRPGGRECTITRTS